MILTLQELRAAARRIKDYSDLMLELSGFTGGRISRFLRPEQIEKIREAAGLPSRIGGETPGYKHRADDYTQRMDSGDVLTGDEFDAIRKDLDAMPDSVRAEMEGGDFQGEAKLAEATAAAPSQEFTLDAGELAKIGRRGK